MEVPREEVLREIQLREMRDERSTSPKSFSLVRMEDTEISNMIINTKWCEKHANTKIPYTQPLPSPSGWP